VGVLALLAPESGTWIEYPPGDRLQHLLDEVEEYFVVFIRPTSFGHFDPRLLVLDEVDDLELLRCPAVELLEGVAVCGELHHRLNVEGAHDLRRGFELDDGVVALHDVEVPLKIDSQFFAIRRVHQRYGEGNFAALGLGPLRIPEVQRQHFSPHDDQLHVVVAVLVPDILVCFLAVPVRLEHLGKLFL